MRIKHFCCTAFLVLAINAGVYADTLSPAPAPASKSDEALSAELDKVLKATEPEPGSDSSASVTPEVYSLYSAGIEAEYNAQNIKAAVFYGKALAVAPGSVVLSAQFGKQLLKLGKRESALLYLNRAVELGLEDADLYIDIAESYNSGGDPFAAREILEKYLSTFLKKEIEDKEDRFETIIRVLGAFYQARKEWAEAIRVYKVLQEINPDNRHSLIQLGKIYDHRRDFASSAREYEKLNKFAPGREVQLVLINAYHKAGEYENAYNLLKKFLEEHPKETDMIFIMGEVCLARGRIQEAIKYYWQLYNEDPKQSAIYGRIVYLTAKSGHDKNAIELIKRGIKAKKDSYYMYRGLEEVAGRMAEADAAALYDDILKNIPQHIYPYILAAQFESGRGDLKKALDILDSAIKHGIDPFQARINKASMLVTAGQRVSAETELRAATLLRPEDYGTRILLVQIMFENRHLKEARAEAEKIIKEKPEFDQANFMLAKILIFEAKFKEALPYAEAAVGDREKCTNPEYLDMLGWIYCHTEKDEEGLKLLLRSSELEPSVQNWEHIGKIYEKLGRDDEAKNAFDEAKKLKSAPGKK